MNDKSYILKGNICYSVEKERIETVAGGYLVCIDGMCVGVFHQIPKEYELLPVKDYADCIIIPGLIDLHIHAPQFSYRGLGMDLELLDWLNQCAFPEEAKYSDLSYAAKAYKIFIDDLKKSATTRACVFASKHVPATELLMDMLEESGLYAMVGKVNMDRNTPDYLCEASAKESAKDTIEWIKKVKGKYENVFPMLTPRFIPTCSDELMEHLQEIQKEYQLPLQSHLSENQGEIAWVKELCPKSSCYGDAYLQHDLFGGDCPTIMAHCVYSSDEEIAMMKERGVFVAHCPQSNTNLASGIAPVRRYLEDGLNVGLGSDVAGGTTGSIFCAMSDAIQVSKLRWRLVDQNLKPLTAEEAFYLATKGGGAFFGKVGSFEEGYEFDAVVIDDSALQHPQELTIKERLERVIYLSESCSIVDKYMKGKIIK